MKSTVIRALGCVSLLAVLGALFWMLSSNRSASADPALRRKASALTADKVIVVGVDGLRLQESYKFYEMQSPYFPQQNHTPRLTAELIPQGTLYTNAQTGVFTTITTPCMNTIVTGAWEGGPNRGRGEGDPDTEYVDNRTFDRTIFEIARRYLSLRQESVGYVTDKLNSLLSSQSYHPAGGDPFAPETHVFLTRFNGDEPSGDETYVDPLNNSDRDVFLSALEAMDTSEPRLLFLWTGNVDIAGHRSISQETIDYSFYAEAIEVWDGLIADFWQEVQARPAYRDRTTLIIVSDHGRHDDHDSEAYGSHEGTCSGTRDLMLLVIGPDTPQGLVVGRRVFQSDIAPTVARVLGMPLPEATGQPLYESLVLAPGPDSRRYLREMRATVDDRDCVHAVYRTADESGNDRIVVQQAMPGGEFGEPVVVSSVPWDSPYFFAFPDILSDELGIHVVAWKWTEENHEYVYWQSVDGGRNFSSPPLPIAEGKVEESPSGHMTLGWPRVFSLLGREHVAAPTVAYRNAGASTLLMRLEYEGFENSIDRMEEDRVPDYRRFGHHRWVEMAESSNGDIYGSYAALQVPTDVNTDPFRSTWEIFFKDLTQTGSSQSAVRLTDDNAIPYVMPSMAVDREADDTVHLVYAGLVDGVFQLHYVRSLNEAKTVWTPPVILTDSHTGAWEPSIAVMNGTLHVVYTDYQTGDGDIYYLKVRDDQILEGPANLSYTAGISRNPKLLVPRFYPHLHVVWEEEGEERGSFTLKRTVLFP